MTADITAAVAQEIAALHRFFEGWLNGSLAGTEAVFVEHLERRLDEDFVNIQPAGVILSRELLLDRIRKGYAASPAFRIRVDKVAVRRHFAERGLILATYEEYQRGARNSAPENTRLSTVLLQQDGSDGSFRWLHIQETWLPEDAISPEAFRF